MTPATAARLYATRLFPIFPCRATGPGRKSPLTQNGFKDASTDAAQIEAWWRQWPNALIGYATGYLSVVLDIDVKNPKANGFDTLDELGFAILPDTPTAHTSSGGLHLHFAAPTPPIGNTCGRRGRGIGDGLDWRGLGGYTILPAPGSGYRWDPAKNFKTTTLAPIPGALLPRTPVRPVIAKPVPLSNGLSKYAETALDSACRNITSAPAGEQEVTLHRECFSIGTLSAGGGIPESFALRVLKYAASNMRSHNQRQPWHPAELDAKVERSFTAGLAHPRSAAR